MEHTLRQLQLRELEIAQAVLDICSRHSLTIYMIGGTFLGAVRHKGFIPWDDDIDLALPRPDYDKLMELLPKELPEKYEHYFFMTDRDMQYYPAQVADPSFKILDTSAQEEKERSAWIDLFPIDGMPNGSVRCFLHKYHLLYLRMMLKFSQFSKVVAVNLAHRPLHERILIGIGKHLHLEKRMDTHRRMVKIDRCLHKYSYDSSDRAVNFMGAYKFKELFPKSIYSELSPFPFEDRSLLGPKDYDTYLRGLYGDYMTPPPRDEQNKHGTTVIGGDEKA